jgi:glycosyltransferase involved in cell wall biosynthesis
VVSEIERDRLQRVSPGYRSIIVVPNGVDLDAYPVGAVPPEPDTLIYSGSLTYSANFDAVDYFLREIYPRLLAKRPGAKFLVTGKLDGVPVERLPRYPGVTFTGYLDDVRPTLARTWASVVPLRLGGGTRLKILEAMALGTPVVATSKGAEGLAVMPGRDLLIADQPAEFAAQTLRLLGDANLRQQLSRSARQLVETQYHWSAISRQFNVFVEQLAEQAVRVRALA